MASGRGHHLKGRKLGGRTKNTPNKATVERAEIARLQNEESVRKGIKLGKQMLEDYMMAFHNQAVVFQPLPAGVSIPGRTPDPAQFMAWGRLVVETAYKLADFQSPKFRAIQVVAPADDRQQGRIIEGKAVDVTDAVAAGRTYLRLVKGVG